MKAPILEVSRYRKEYRGKVAVRDLSLSLGVPRGDLRFHRA